MLRAALNLLARLRDRFRRPRLHTMRLKLENGGRDGGTIELLDPRGRRLAKPVYLNPDRRASLPEGRYAIVETPAPEGAWRLRIAGEAAQPETQSFVIATTRAGVSEHRVALVVPSRAAAAVAEWLAAEKGAATVAVVVEERRRMTGEADDSDIGPADRDTDSSPADDSSTAGTSRGGRRRSSELGTDDRRTVPKRRDDTGRRRTEPGAGTASDRRSGDSPRATESGTAGPTGPGSADDRSRSGDAFRRGGGSFGGAGASAGWDPEPTTGEAGAHGTEQEAAAKGALSAMGYGLLQDQDGAAGTPAAGATSGAGEEPASAAPDTPAAPVRDTADAGSAGEPASSPETPSSGGSSGSAADAAADSAGAGSTTAGGDWTPGGGAYGST